MDFETINLNNLEFTFDQPFLVIYFKMKSLTKDQNENIFEVQKTKLLDTKYKVNKYDQSNKRLQRKIKS